MGRRLVAEVEAEALRRGCGQAVVFTHAAVGGAVFRAWGYRVVARLEDYPVGDSALWLAKRLR